jgi:putative spermidine/putrescine transport system ATP-binding protein
MNQGRIEQVGTPFEIYNFPQTHFVASFVGTLNLIPAEVVDPAHGVVRVAGQTIQTERALPGTQVGEAVSLALRPELIVVDGENGATNHLTGTVENISFLGSIVRLQVRSGEVVFALDEFNNPNLTLPEIGAPVTARFPAEACLILDNRGRAHNAG